MATALLLYDIDVVAVLVTAWACLGPVSVVFLEVVLVHAGLNGLVLRKPDDALPAALAEKAISGFFEPWAIGSLQRSVSGSRVCELWEVVCRADDGPPGSDLIEAA